MGRAKIKRGSTNIDMTAMCDVAFLLLSFFILTTQFKPAEAKEVVTPSSVSTETATQENAFTVYLDKDGKVYIVMSDDMKGDVIQEVANIKNINFSADDIKMFKAAPFVGTPLSQLNQFDRLSSQEVSKVNVSGIPSDSTNNELEVWINAAKKANQGKKLNFLIKGDDKASYPSFKQVIEAFKKNDEYKYKLITTPEGVPEGTALFENATKGIK
jgi:biopolymer transport protein ExbD